MGTARVSPQLRYSQADTLHLQTQATIIPGAGTEDAAAPPRPAPATRPRD